MSFATDIRQELARAASDQRCCARAECAALLFGSGGLTFRGPGRYGVAIHTENAAVARRAFLLSKKHLGATMEIRAAKNNRLGEHTRYSLAPDEADVPLLLKELSLLDAGAPFGLRAAPDSALLVNECCARAFLRGVFLICGTCTNPEKAYHMEFVAADEVFAACVEDQLKRMEIPARTHERKGQFAVYIKESEAIAQFLALTGAHNAMLALENTRILKGVRNAVNRQVNCDSSNLEKTLEASEKQLSIIRSIEREMGLEALRAPLRELAELRLKYPDATLNELGGMCTPQLGKSGVNARMRRLEALAEELVNR